MTEPRPERCSNRPARRDVALAFWRSPLVAACGCLLALVTLAAQHPASGVGRTAPTARGATATPNPILFVTQVPVPADFATIGSVFANHGARMTQVARGGDLWIRYPDGSLRNLTAEAGYGVQSGLQGTGAIAVRDPAVHDSGTRALFSMVVGAPQVQYQVGTWYWQIYEISGLGQGQTAVVTHVAGQPANANNVAPIYLSDGAAGERIAFTSDRPRGGEAHLYPQLDEYESTATVTGIWSLERATAKLALLDHAPSGDFTPIVDSFGRIVFTRWDHLQQDQQADADALAGSPIYGAFDYADESAGAAQLPLAPEVFPEPRPARTDLLAGTPWRGHRLNRFFPWTMRQDGTGLEMINHVGRHEMVDYFDRSRNDDPNLDEFIASRDRPGYDTVESLLQIREDPDQPGRYIATDAPEFQTHAAGRLIVFEAPPGAPPHQLAPSYLTHPITNQVIGAPAPPEHSGHYRDPLILSGGAVVAAHAAETGVAGNNGTYSHPIPRYEFRLVLLQPAGNGHLEAGTPLTAGIDKTVTYWDPDTLITYSGELWELQPVEVTARTPPPDPPAELEAPELTVFDQQGVDPEHLRAWLRQQGLALMVTRNATTRDVADKQQPFWLEVPGGAATVGGSGTVYPISDLQIFQGDQVRGYSEFNQGRRVLARALHDPAAVAANPPGAAAPGSVEIALDGSAAAFVPARRALSWQTLSPGGEPVVRERFWVTFQPGEIRACDGCHGVNDTNQAAQPGVATNPPQALAALLERWRTVLTGIFADGFESGDPSAWSAATP